MFKGLSGILGAIRWRRQQPWETAWRGRSMGRWVNRRRDGRWARRPPTAAGAGRSTRGSGPACRACCRCLPVARCRAVAHCARASRATARYRRVSLWRLTSRPGALRSSRRWCCAGSSGTATRTRSARACGFAARQAGSKAGAGPGCRGRARMGARARPPTVWWRWMRPAG